MITYYFMSVQSSNCGKFSNIVPTILSVICLIPVTGKALGNNANDRSRSSGGAASIWSSVGLESVWTHETSNTLRCISAVYNILTTYLYNIVHSDSDSLAYPHICNTKQTTLNQLPFFSGSNNGRFSRMQKTLSKNLVIIIISTIVCYQNTCCKLSGGRRHHLL